MVSTHEVLDLIADRGVIVGSWPSKGDKAKDLDVVVPERSPEDGRHPLFQEIVSLWGDHCESTGPGHLCVHADPIRVEMFEDLGFLPDDPVKAEGAMGFADARERAVPVDAYGVQMAAVT